MNPNATPISKVFEEIPVAIQNTAEEKMWNSLKLHFRLAAIGDYDLYKFIEEVQRYYRTHTYKWLCKENGPLMAYIGMPLLCHRLVKLGILVDGKPHFTIPVTLHPGDGSRLNLQLPYEIIPELEQLKLSDDLLTERHRYPLDYDKLYFLSAFHYKGHPELIGKYSLDVEEANDRHYEFSVATGEQLCRQLYYHPRALPAALMMYLRQNKGWALESLIRSRADATFHY